jgi:uncharacterized protein HemX
VPPAPQPAPSADDRLAGLRAWLAQLDRRLGLRTYVIGAVAVLALAAGVVALVLTLQLRQDAATNGDVSSVRDQLAGVERSATQVAEESVHSLHQRIGDLEAELDRISSAQAVDRHELKALQEDVRGLRGQGSPGSGGRPEAKKAP